MKTIIASPKAPKAVGPYSQAVKCGDTLYISGQLPIDGATGAMPESIEDQTRQSLTNLGHILEEAGYSHADIVKTTVLLTDIADFAAMNAVYATFFTKDMPARICYQVSSCRWVRRSRSMRSPSSKTRPVSGNTDGRTALRRP